MRTRTILAAAAIGAVAILPATADAATLRVVSGKRTILSVRQVNVGSARAYLDTAGRSHRLKANTALGQLITANAFYNTYLRISYMSGLGAYVTRIAGVAAPKKGYWALFVNGDMAPLGADSTIVHRDDSVIWIGDDDYSSKNGPWVFQLDANARASGMVTFTGVRIGGAKATPAKGVPLVVNGEQTVTLDGDGKATVRLSGAWTATLAARGRTAASLPISGTSPTCRSGAARAC